jgi:hypothetical protein
MTRLTVHEYAGALRPRHRAAKEGVKRAGLKTASLKAGLRGNSHAGVQA